MKNGKIVTLTLAFVLAIVSLSALAQDSVTVPKSRLEERERKEAELEKLKGDLNKTKGENVQLKKQHEADAVKITEAPPPVVKYVSPPMNSLPAIASGETVESMDLADHYRAEPAVADQRYRKHVFKVQGEIVGFEKTLFIKPYKILLKTPDRKTKVICVVQPPEKYSAVFTIKDGAELVGTIPQHENQSIAKVGDTVVIVGKCEGLSDSTIKMSGCELKSVR